MKVSAIKKIREIKQKPFLALYHGQSGTEKSCSKLGHTAAKSKLINACLVLRDLNWLGVMITVVFSADDGLF